MRVAITGSTGLIGTALVASLRGAGHQVTRLVRRPPGPGEVRWDPAAGTIDGAGLEGHDAVVHLAGAGIGDHRWTEAYKAEIRDSRVKGTTLLAEALAALERPPAVLASASGINVYADRGDEVLTEASPPGEGFLAGVVREWEAATDAASAAGIRVAHLRNAVVLSRRGGALRARLLPFRLGLGGRLASGRQWFSWISLDDEVAAIIHVLGDATVAGPVNMAAPSPVTNAEFTRALGRALGRPAVLRVPAAALAVLRGGELTREVVLASMRVVPGVLPATGFQFRHPTVDEGLRAALA